MYLALKIFIISLFLSSLALNGYLIQKGGVKPNKPLSSPSTEIIQSTQSQSLGLDYDGSVVSHGVLEDRKRNLEKYLIPTKTHVDFDVHFYDAKTDRIHQVISTVGINNISISVRYDEDKDTTFEQEEKFNFQLPPSIFKYALYKSDNTSPKQKFGFVGESFAIQKNGYQLVAINEDKVNWFYMDTNLHTSDYYLPRISAKLPVTQITILNGYDIADQFYFTGREGGGDDWGLHFLPICYDDSSRELFVVEADGGGEVAQYLKVGWSKTHGGEEMTTVGKSQISCLQEAYTLDDLYAQRN